MRVLVACEFSGKVREAFREQGHETYSCDLLDSEPYSPFHIKGDCLTLLQQQWDIVIAHPPCTHLCVSGARWWHKKKQDQEDAIDFFLRLWSTSCAKICIENPIGIMSRYVKPSQIIQPWQFGHGETKATCLWLKGLPNLTPTDIVSGREARIHKMPPSKDRSKLRSITYDGIAKAMALQWGKSKDCRQESTVGAVSAKEKQ